jgi:hypothetical protein
MQKLFSIFFLGTTLLLANVAPSIGTISPQTVQEDNPAFSLIIDSNDSDGDHLTHTAILDDLALATTTIQPLGTQVGNDIDGEAQDDRSGSSVSLNHDGSIVAIGAPNNESYTGHVRVFELNNTTFLWEQRGQDIDGEAQNDRSGHSVSINDNGTRVAIGAYYNNGVATKAGHAQVFEYNDQTDTWVQLGSDINGDAANDWAGFSVSLNGSGSRVAVGAPYNDGGSANAGQVRIYEYNSGSHTWVQLGDDIYGETSGDLSGYAISLSQDGNYIAIGAISNDGFSTNAGHVRIYHYSNGQWSQYGDDIDGEAANDNSGYGVSISQNGTYVAIGAPYNDDTDTDAGHARVYKYDAGTWTQIGNDLNGEAREDWFGRSVAISDDGTRLMVGAPQNDDTAANAGSAYFYEYNAQSNEWTQLGNDFDGEAYDDKSGLFVAISGTGLRSAIGAYNNDGMNENNNGHVRVYSLSNTLTITPKADAFGETNCTVTADDGHLQTSTTFLLTISAENDQPKILQTIEDITLDEDFGTYVYEINVSDVERDDLNISVRTDTNATIFLTPTWNSTTWVSQDTYHNKILELNISSLQNQYGTTQVTINVEDNASASIEKSFSVIVNDMPNIVHVVLKQGWNLLTSLSNQPIAVENIQTLYPNYQIVYQYTSGSWKAFSDDQDLQSAITSSPFSHIASLNVAEGFWVYNNVEENLSIDSQVDYNVSLSNYLSTAESGWHLVGSNMDISPDIIFSSFPKAKIIWVYRDQTWHGKSPWNMFNEIIGSHETKELLVNIKQGEGFWVFIQ